MLIKSKQLQIHTYISQIQIKKDKFELLDELIYLLPQLTNKYQIVTSFSEPFPFSQLLMLLEADSQNLQKLIDQYNYDFQYLRPQPKVITVKQSQKDLFYWKDKDQTQKGRRRIYYKVDFTEQENNAIQQVLEQLPKKGIIIKLSKQLILKHLHVQKLSIASTVDRLIELQKFYNSKITQLSHTTILNLKKGFIYAYGYSKNYRPIVILRVDKIDNDMEVQDIFNTLYYLMIVLCSYKMQAYHSQKYIIIIDLNHMNISQIPYPRIYSCLTKLALYSCGFTDQNFVVNASGIWAVWTFIKGFLPQYAVKKIIFLDKVQPLQQHIEPDELQERYGGNRPNIEDGQFWPPLASKKCIYQTNQMIQEYSLQQTDYHSVCNDEAIFMNGYPDLTYEQVNQSGGCCNQNCTIY